MDTPETVPPAKRRWLPSPVAVTGVVLAGLVAYGLVLGGGPSNEDLQAGRDKVSDCWNEARRKQGSADQQRIKMAECEGLESAFRKKFGGTP